MPPEAGEIYFLEAENGLIKIGFSKDARTRILNIKTMSPISLVTLKIISGTRQEEKIIQEAFSDLNHHGEWFKTSPRLKAYIETLNTDYFFPSERRISLKEAMESKKLTFEKLSRLTGLSTTTLSSIEKGKSNVRLSTARRIIRVLGKSIRLIDLLYPSRKKAA